MSSNAFRSERPPRLKEACNNCNLSKLKCSRDKSSCTRCTRLNVDCIYEESRVGRNQLGRSRTKKSQDQDSVHQNQASRVEGFQIPTSQVESISNVHRSEQLPSPASSTREGGNNSVRSNNTMHIHSLHEPVMDWFSDLPASADIDGISETIDGFHAAGTPSVNPQTLVFPDTSIQDGTDLNLDLDHMLSQAPANYPHTGSSHAQTLHSARGIQRQEEQQETRCLIACSQIVDNLARHSLSGTQNLSLSLLLGIISKAREQVTSEFKNLQGFTYDTCIAVLKVVLIQLARMLDVACSLLSTGHIPGFSLAGIQMKTEDHVALQAVLVKKEVRKADQLAKAIAQCLSQNMNACTEWEAISTWFQELCERLEAASNADDESF